MNVIEKLGEILIVQELKTMNHGSEIGKCVGHG